MSLGLFTRVSSFWGRLSSWGDAADSSAGQDFHDTHLSVPAGYKLVRWPHLPSRMRTAKVLKALSVMSHRGVSVRWLSLQLDWSHERATQFLESLAESGDAKRLG